jgi:hypothetical protein
VFDLAGDTISIQDAAPTLTFTTGAPQSEALFGSINIAAHGATAVGEYSATFSQTITFDNGVSETFSRTFRYSVTSTTRSYSIDAAGAKTVDLGARGKLDITPNQRATTSGCPNGNTITCTTPARNDDATFLLHDIPGGGCPTPQTFQFSAATYSVGEGASVLSVTVTRSGNTTAPANVDYATAPDSATLGCEVVNGAASDRCDYTTTIGTLRFSAGETSKTFDIFITDDAYVEGAETFSISLSAPIAGASLAAPSTATVTINDNDAAPTNANPIDSPSFFVGMHYVDFLNRLGEPAGIQGWVNALNNCPAGNTSCDRVSVSANFFRSQEFQIKGFFVIRFYKVSLGPPPSYRDFIRDSQRVTATTDAGLAAARDAFTNEWAQRADFRAIYDPLSNQAYVDKLEQTAGVTLSNKAQLVAALDSATKTRAQVLREIVESAEVQRKMYNDAFVLMEYYGYLRRDAETGGFNAWLTYLNAHPTDFRSMVSGFMNSIEYRKRFGQP